MANLLGYAASCAVLATFLMQTMVPLRLVAILSNFLFLSYGYVQHIYPVLFLHAVLLPINLWRLLTIQRPPHLQPQTGASDSRRRSPQLKGLTRAIAAMFGPWREYDEIVDELSSLPDHALADLRTTRRKVRGFAGCCAKRDGARRPVESTPDAATASSELVSASGS